MKYAPYKKVFLFFTVPDGWKDLGETGNFPTDEIRPYDVTIFGDRITGIENVKVSYQCPTCARRLRIGQVKKTNHLFYYCPNCKRMFKAEGLTEENL